MESIAIGECRLEVASWGSGPPLLVLHGEDGTVFCRRFLEALGRQFHVHVPSHPGWPGSTRPDYIRTVRDLALVQQEYVERLGRPVPVVGLSFGGWVAAELAVNAPALVSSLVLISPIGVKVGGREDRDFVDLYMTDPDKRLGLYYANAAPRPEPRGNEDVFFEMATAAEAVARFCWTPYMHDPGLAKRLRRVAAPTLILSGAADRFVLNPDYYDAYAALIGRGATHRPIEGAGHRVEEERTEQVVDAITRFLASAGHAEAELTR